MCLEQRKTNPPLPATQTHCQPPQFSTSHHKPTKPHHKFNKNYQIHHQLPQIQSHKRKNKSTNRKKIKQNPQPAQEQIHKISKDQAKPTPTPKSNRRHRRALFFWGGFNRGAAASIARGGFDPIVVLYFFGAASIWGDGFDLGRRLQSRGAASIWGGGFDLGRVLKSHHAAVNHELGSRSGAVERERAEKESRE
jgi:hypothetical protein